MSEIDRAENGTDRTDIDLSVGATWDITGRTGGSASIGIGRSDFDLDGADAETDLTLEVGLFYQPRSFSRFDVSLLRNFFNDGLGTLSNVATFNRLDLDWRYTYSSRVFHRASLDVLSIERTCPEVGDITSTLSFELGVQARRWLAFGLGASAEQRSNDNCPGPAAIVEAPDFDRQEVFLFTRVNL